MFPKMSSTHAYPLELYVFLLLISGLHRSGSILPTIGHGPPLVYPRVGRREQEAAVT